MNGKNEPPQTIKIRNNVTQEIKQQLLAAAEKYQEESASDAGGAAVVSFANEFVKGLAAAELLDEIRKADDDMSDRLFRFSNIVQWPNRKPAYLNWLRMVATPDKNTRIYLGADLLPNLRSIQNAAKVLSLFLDLKIAVYAVRCSGSGGVGIVLGDPASCYVHLEIGNDGDLETFTPKNRPIDPSSPPSVFS